MILRIYGLDGYGLRNPDNLRNHVCPGQMYNDNPKTTMLERKNETYAIIGAAMEVHRVLGCGLPEKVYQDAFEEELRLRNIPYTREQHFAVTYKDKVLEHDFYADFFCYDSVVVELKATSVIEDIHKAQIISYLKASKVKVGLLINFGEESLIYDRFYNSDGVI